MWYVVVTENYSKCLLISHSYVCKGLFWKSLASSQLLGMAVEMEGAWYRPMRCSALGELGPRFSQLLDTSSNLGYWLGDQFSQVVLAYFFSSVFSNSLIILFISSWGLGGKMRWWLLLGSVNWNRLRRKYFASICNIYMSVMMDGE